MRRERRYIMVKKMKSLAIVALMLFGVGALTACTLEEDKIVAKGTFYSLQEAYDKKLLTIEDLQRIASFPNSDPEQLNTEVAINIMEAWAKTIRTRDINPILAATVDDIMIIGYFGTYNKCVAVRLNDSFTDYPDVVREVIVAGVTFVYSGASIIIWK